MAIEQQRGISVSSSVMTFEHEGLRFNLLDTPGHEDFSEDTYRTLTAVDAAIMVIDAAKGIEPQTRKLFEVCRLRSIPIITFVNKVDREGRDPFELMDEIADMLALDVTPMNWPAGMGGLYRGLYQFDGDTFEVPHTVKDAKGGTLHSLSGLDDPALETLIPADAAIKLREEAGLAQEASPPFDADAFLGGDLTPVYFGSALREHGIGTLLAALAKHLPPPGSQPAQPAPVAPDTAQVTGFVFKMQANMDPNHRDRVAFVRICSGTFKRGMKLTVARTGKTLAVSNPIFFMALDRARAEEARPGDIIGIPNHGTLRVGDTLTEKGGLHFTGLPDFAPEILRRVRLGDPMKAKQMRRGLSDLAEEGVVRLFKPSIGAQWIVGVVGALQLDVMQARMEAEYSLPIAFEPSPHDIARWISGSEDDIEAFAARYRASIGEDSDGHPVALVRNSWEMGEFERNFPKLRFVTVRERVG